MSMYELSILQCNSCHKHTVQSVGTSFYVPPEESAPRSGIDPCGQCGSRDYEMIKLKEGQDVWDEYKRLDKRIS